MSITNKDIQKALRIKKAVNDFFDSSSTVEKIQAKELMNLFISKGIFRKNYKDGLPIRAFLRHLNENDQLDLIPQVYFEQKAKNKNWYFIKNNQSENLM